MQDDIVQVDGVSRRFGSKRALDSVCLQIPRGSVYGLIGENGAGKTTLLKHILGLYKPQEGAVRVFGMDPVASPAEVLAKIGYLSEDRALPGWMSVQQLISYTSAFYPDWDTSFAEEMRQMFELPNKTRVSTLSRGQTARLGLLLACAYRAPLLVLDEPSSGLDPIVRRDILGAVIRTVADEGRTVLFSSHLLDEVQRVADRFSMLHHGKNVFTSLLDVAIDSHTKIVAQFAESVDAGNMEGVLLAKGEGRDWVFMCNGQQMAVEQSIQDRGGVIVDRAHLSLEEIFLARTAEAAKP